MWAIHHRFFRRGTQAVRLGVLDLGKDRVPVDSATWLAGPGRDQARIRTYPFGQMLRKLPT